MTSPSIFWSEQVKPFCFFIVFLAAVLTAFLFGVGLGPDRLPFPPDSRFSDAVTSHWPDALFLRRAILEDHSWPLWRPLLMSGQPFSANPLNKVWYPPQWLVLITPPTLHLNILIWLHLLLAGAGAWIWSCATGLKPWPAALVGFGYAFSPRLIALLGAGHLDIIDAAAWFPWLLWGVYRFVRPHPARGSILALGGFAALCFLADVRLCAYAWVTAFAYLLWRWSQTPDLHNRPAAWRLLIHLLSAALLTAGLTAVVWLPLLLYRADLSREAISLNDAAMNSLKLGQWIGLIFGDSNSWESMVYVGISTLLLAGAALLLRPRQLAFWGVVILVAAMYAMGNHFVLWTMLARLLPPIRWWRVPPRSWLIAALILPYLAGWGAQLLAEQPSERRAARQIAFGLLGGGLACSLFSAIMLAPPLDQKVALGLFALPALALVVLLAVFGRVPARTLLIAFTVVVTADVLWIDQTLVKGRSESEWLDPYRDVAQFLREDGVVRIYSPSYSFPQQAAVYWRIPQFGGVDPFQFKSYVRAAETATGVKAAGYSVTIPAFEGVSGDDFSKANQDAALDPRQLGEWLVTHIVSAYPLSTEGLELAAQIDDVYIYRNTFAPDINLDWDGPNTVTIRANEPITGRLYAVAAGRWQNQDGKPGLPGPVDGSAQKWTLNYDLSEIWLSLITGAALIVAAGLMGWSLRYAS